MKCKITILILLLVLQFSQVQGDGYNFLEVEGELTEYTIGEESPTFYGIDIPWHHQENSISCGPACLKMVFDSLGYSSLESEIRAASNTNPEWGGTYTTDLIRACHFSNYSTAPGSTELHGYSDRWYGIDCIEYDFEGQLDEWETVTSELKQLILEEQRMILLMWYTESAQYGHYRVLRGYDSRNYHFIFADPMEHNAVSGINWSISSEDLEWWWNRAGRPYWIQQIQEWNLVSNIVNSSLDSQVEVHTTIDCGMDSIHRSVWSLSDCILEIQIPEGYTNTTSLSIPFAFDESGKAQVQWNISYVETPMPDDVFNIQASGTITGWSYSSHEYEDKIMVQDTISVYDDAAPLIEHTGVDYENQTHIKIQCEMGDIETLSQVELQYRTEPGLWERKSLEMNESHAYTTLEYIPENLLQFRIHIEDIFGNVRYSSVFEYVQSDDIDPNGLSEFDPIIVAIVVLGVIALVVVVSFLRRKAHLS